MALSRDLKGCFTYYSPEPQSCYERKARKIQIEEYSTVYLTCWQNYHDHQIIRILRQAKKLPQTKGGQRDLTTNCNVNS